MKNPVKDALFGVAVGDALGVPVEFEYREELDISPVTDMLGYGTYNQPQGTWSDDTSLTLCLADSLCKGFSLTDMAKMFIAWRDNALWTAHDEVFDIGNTTSQSISLLRQVLKEPLREVILEELISTGDERSNGNGSLMRIIPLLFYTKDLPEIEQWKITKLVVSLTHPHERGAMACHIYLTFANYILKKETKETAFEKTKRQVLTFFKEINYPEKEQKIFDNILKKDIANFKRSHIKSSGYVVESLEASFWCVLNENSYKSTVLSAVNLGFDTDTTAAIAGGLAGLIYGFENIPKIWVHTLARQTDIALLSEKLYKKYFQEK